jgi:hypothetical protein
MVGKRGAKRTKSKGLRARCWWIIRKNKQTTLADLLMVLNDGSHQHADRNLGQYLTFLTRVGVLSRERINDGKPTSNGVYLYRLANDLGCKNPIIRKSGVYDPNSQVLLSWSSSQQLESTSQGLNSLWSVS